MLATTRMGANSSKPTSTPGQQAQTSRSIIGIGLKDPIGGRNQRQLQSGGDLQDFQAPGHPEEQASKTLKRSLPPPLQQMVQCGEGIRGTSILLAPHVGESKRGKRSLAQTEVGVLPAGQQLVQAAGEIAKCTILFGDSPDKGQSTAGAEPTAQLPEQPHLQQLQIGGNVGPGANIHQLSGGPFIFGSNATVTIVHHHHHHHITPPACLTAQEIPILPLRRPLDVMSGRKKKLFLRAGQFIYADVWDNLVKQKNTRKMLLRIGRRLLTGLDGTFTVTGVSRRLENKKLDSRHICTLKTVLRVFLCLIYKEDKSSAYDVETFESHCIDSKAEYMWWTRKGPNETLSQLEKLVASLLSQLNKF